MPELGPVGTGPTRNVIYIINKVLAAFSVI